MARGRVEFERVCRILEMAQAVVSKALCVQQRLYRFRTYLLELCARE